MAHTQEVPVGDVVKSSQALAFIAYPEALAQLPVSPLWSFLFFFMLITLGLDSQVGIGRRSSGSLFLYPMSLFEPPLQFTMVETITTAIFDQYPNLRRKKALVVIGTSICGFLLGLSMCTKGGVYLFNLLDW